MAPNKIKTGSTKSKKKKAWGSKQVLASPFAPTIPSPNPSTCNAVLEILLDVFPTPFAKRPSRPRPKTPTKTPDGDQPVDTAKTEEPPAKRRRKDEENVICKKPTGLLCGVNEVSRALEKDLVEIVVLSRDVVPAIMISHIPVLCFLKSAKLIVMPGSGAGIGAIFGTQRVLAFAIKRDAKDSLDEHSPAKRLAEKLSPLAIDLNYPWLAVGKGTSPPALPDPIVIPHRSRKEIG